MTAQKTPYEEKIERQALERFKECKANGKDCCNCKEQECDMWALYSVDACSFREKFGCSECSRIVCYMNPNFVPEETQTIQRLIDSKTYNKERQP
jgi:hypothetical protein